MNIIDKIKSSFFGSTKAQDEPSRSVSAGVFTTTKRDLKNSGTNFLMQVNKAQDEPSLVSAGAFTATKRDLKNSGTNFLNNLDFFVSQQIMVNGEYYTVEYIEKEQGMHILTLNKLGAR